MTILLGPYLASCWKGFTNVVCSATVLRLPSHKARVLEFRAGLGYGFIDAVEDSNKGCFRCPGRLSGAQLPVRIPRELHDTLCF